MVHVDCSVLMQLCVSLVNLSVGVGQAGFSECFRIIM